MITLKFLQLVGWGTGNLPDWMAKYNNSATPKPALRNLASRARPTASLSCRYVAGVKHRSVQSAKLCIIMTSMKLHVAGVFSFAACASHRAIMIIMQG